MAGAAGFAACAEGTAVCGVAAAFAELACAGLACAGFAGWAEKTDGDIASKTTSPHKAASGQGRIKRKSFIPGCLISWAERRVRPGQAAAGAVKPIPVYGRPGLVGQLTQYPAQGRERLQPERLTGWLQALVQQLPQALP